MEGQEPLDIEQVDHLYQLAPGEFIAARDRLAKKLKAEGDGHRASAVKRLRRPTVVAWALNQVARAHPEESDQLKSPPSWPGQPPNWPVLRTTMAR